MSNTKHQLSMEDLGLKFFSGQEDSEKINDLVVKIVPLLEGHSILQFENALLK